MDASIVKEEIKRIMEALNEQLLIINDHKKRIPQIEIDLILENIRDLYTALKDLNDLNSKEFIQTHQPVSDKQEMINVPVEQKPELITETTNDEDVEESLTDESFEEEEVSIPFSFKEQIRFEPVIEQDVAKEENIPPAFEPKATIQQELAGEPKPPVPSTGDLFSVNQGNSISDKYKDEKKTLNERLQQDKADNTLGSKLQQNQISDIKTVIGINEKFQFINELFAGSMQDYTMAISQLNQFRNLEEAINFIDILKFKYNWDMNADAYRKIMEIVRRRYH